MENGVLTPLILSLMSELDLLAWVVNQGAERQDCDASLTYLPNVT